MKYCKLELSFFIFTSYERSECFIFGVKRKMLHSRMKWLAARTEMKTGAASSSGVFYEAFCGDAAKYEALCVLHASGVSSAQKHEAALRAMKQSLTASFRHFFAVQKCSYGIAFISFRLSRIFGKKNGGWLFYHHPPF